MGGFGGEETVMTHFKILSRHCVEGRGWLRKDKLGFRVAES
jgi:hypothetical protein